MSVHNGEKYLRESIESILNQTYSDFEFIIFDDGSTDGSAEMIMAYTDARIRLISQSEQRGLAHTLNQGIDLAQAEYIARMDADDISLPERLAAQLQLLDANPEVSVLGTAARIIDENSQPGFEVHFPEEHLLIYWHLLFFTNPIVHPSVMMRKSMVKAAGGYNPQREVSQDYELWTRLAGVSRLANLPEIHLSLRKHSSNISLNKEELQFLNAKMLCGELYQYQFGIQLNENTLDGFARYFRHGKQLDENQVPLLTDMMFRISLQLLKEKRYKKAEKRLLIKHINQQFEILVNHVNTKSIHDRLILSKKKFNHQQRWLLII